MTITRCTRKKCDWLPEASDTPERQQLLDHAEAADHPLCAVCSRSLQTEETRTCEKCLTRSRSNLEDIVDLYAVLPEQLGHPAMQVYDRPGRRDEYDIPLPGGTALVMLGPGGSGSASRRLTTKEQQDGAAGREHGWDNRDTDGTAVVYALAEWERDWREARSEPPAPSITLITVAGYLERRMRWAAETLDTFPDFAAELRALRQEMQDVTGRSDRPLRAPAVCFKCGADALERAWTDDGLAERWTCGRCHRVYEQAEYWLAVKAAMGGRPTAPPKEPRRPCPNCGFVRCPHAWHTRYRCSASDEPNQVPRLATATCAC